MRNSNFHPALAESEVSGLLGLATGEHGPFFPPVEHHPLVMFSHRSSNQFVQLGEQLVFSSSEKFRDFLPAINRKFEPQNSRPGWFERSGVNPKKIQNVRR